MAGAKSANTGAATAATAATAAGSSTPTGPATPSAPAGRFSLFSRSTSNASATKAAADAAKADAANREQLVSARRKLFTSAETRQQVMINPDTVFAFESFNPFFDPNTFRIKMPAVSIDLRSMLCGQPFRMALRSKDKSVTFLVIEILVSDAASASGNGNGSGNGSGNGDDGSGNGGDDEDGVGDLRDMGMTGSTLSGGAASGIWGDNDIVLDEDIPKLPGDEAV
ncbi:hypothetical protein BC831DRAFT_446524 [Entophlyctis helioformis]|nr:hypothetical protein BC831DRAFT_446524 [Entophlyctis helioformis]